MNKPIPPAAPAWKEELTHAADRFHGIACWAAIILNPVWSLGDWLTIPLHWNDFFVIRILVAALTAIGLILRKSKKISTEILVFIPFFGISMQNAYMYSVMDVETLQKHTFAYIALFIGAGMLILWNARYTIVVAVLSIIGNIIFFLLFSSLSMSEILSNGGMLTGTVMIFSIILVQNRYSLTKKEIIARLALEASNKELEVKNAIIEEKNKDITDSINYAKRIQQALLPLDEEVRRLLPQSFVLFRPKDIVSGDFYWITKKENTVYFTASDCTGHGVPGAFVSMINMELLNEAIHVKSIMKPGEVFDEVRTGLIRALKQTSAIGQQKDGMDSALCGLTYRPDGKAILRCAGGNNSVFIVTKSDTPIEVIKESETSVERKELLEPQENQDGYFIFEIKPDKQPVGISDLLKPFTTFRMELGKGDTIYISTDGYEDQFGGPGGKKFMRKRLKELWLSIQHIPIFDQKEVMNKTFTDWVGNLGQLDDVCVIGVKI